VLDDGGRAQGIFTRHDVLERVALQRPPEDTPIAQLMTAPVQTLDIHASAQDAALLMSRHGIRHLPLTEGDGERVLSMVSERDLFALQRQSLKQIGGVIRGAADTAALVHAAAEIRRFAGLLLAQGLTARVLTEMLSHLNDLLTERLVQITATAHGLDLGRAAWLAFGSEGRSEQTIATDQDNGLVLVNEVGTAEQARWLALGHAVNLALAECGYPLCSGNVMAGNPECCLTLQGWSSRFANWMDQGAPEDLLKASIYFDLRPLAGATALAWPLRELITQRAVELPRFRKQLADNALNRRPPLNWRGGLEAQADGDAAWLDLKLGGSAIFVDAARLLALAHGVAATPTRERLQGAGLALHLRDKDIADWLGAFDALQMFRLRQQVRPDLDPERPNHIDIKALSTLDRRLLKESLRVAQALQQRLEMDYAG
jgi:CBS domain-containing protein